jgi:branched-chain amino acid aminotransferase
MDRGFIVGDVIFDVARTFNGKSFRMEQHIDRLYRSLKYVRIDPGLSPREMYDISEEASPATNICEKRRGISP